MLTSDETNQAVNAAVAIGGGGGGVGTSNGANIPGIRGETIDEDDNDSGGVDSQNYDDYEDDYDDDSDEFNSSNNQKFNTYRPRPFNTPVTAYPPVYCMYFN